MSEPTVLPPVQGTHLPASGRSVLILARPGGAPGVRKKILGWADALQRAGCRVELAMLEGPGRSNLAHGWATLGRPGVEVIYLRQDWTTLPLLPQIVRARWRGARVVYDVATPAAAGLHEIRMSAMGARAKAVAIALTLANPMARWPASRVLQYGEESRYFSMGVRRRTRLVTNAIEVDAVPVAAEATSDEPLRMVAVGAMRAQHGLDRLLRGLQGYGHRRQARPVELVVVGGGRPAPPLADLCESMPPNVRITLTGELLGPALDRVFDGAHLGIGTLGFHRAGLSVASPLKHRDYVARGLPLVFSVRDADFPATLPWCYQASPSDDPLDVADLLGWLGALPPQEVLRPEIRRYAQDHLDFSCHLHELFD